MDAPTQQRIAALAADWAAEVSPRVRAAAPNPRGTALETFAHHVRGRDPQDPLTLMFYSAVEETVCQTIPWRPGATELEEGETRRIGHLIKWLIGDTQTIAAPFDLQRLAIPERFVCLADEIALEFSERLQCFLPEAGFLRGFLMARQLEALIRLDKWLESFSGQKNAELWTDQALQHAPQWARARELARAALVLFGVELN